MGREGKITGEVKKDTIKKAFAVVLAAVILIGAGEVIWQYAHSLTRQSFQQSFTESSLQASPLAWAQDEGLFRDLGYAEAPLYQMRTGQMSDSIPESFIKEIFDISPYKEVFIAEESDVIGFWTEESLIQEQLEQSLDSKGWILVPTGSSALSSFVCDTGSYRWLLVQYVKTNGGTSVVVQYQ